MNKVARKQYCLQIMGITSWRLRHGEETPPLSKHRYLILVGEELNNEGHQLINRMLQALEWPIEETRIEKLEDASLVTAFFSQKIKETQAEKALLYGHILSEKLVQTTLNPHLLSVGGRQITIGILPTVHELLNDITAKKRAWQVMREMISVMPAKAGI